MAKRPLKEFNAQIGQIFRTIVEYVDGQGEKERPVIIVAIDTDISIAVSLKITKTGIEPRKNRPWDKYKVPVYNWRKAGLTAPSYVECSTMFDIKSNILVEYVGEMHESDFERVLNEFEKFIQENNEVNINK